MIDPIQNAILLNQIAIMEALIEITDSDNQDALDERVTITENVLKTVV